MFATTQMMGLNVGFPDVLTTPTTPGPVPLPYPDLGVSPKAPPARIFVRWGSDVRGQLSAQTKASKELHKAVGTILDVKSRVAKAMDEVNGILGRIETLQAQQKKIVANAAKMEGEVAKGFKGLEKQAKSKDAKAKETAKAVLIAKGIALNALFLALEGLNKSLSKEQAALEKAAKKLK